MCVRACVCVCVCACVCMCVCACKSKVYTLKVNANIIKKIVLGTLYLSLQVNESDCGVKNYSFLRLKKKVGCY